MPVVGCCPNRLVPVAPVGAAAVVLAVPNKLLPAGVPPNNEGAEFDVPNPPVAGVVVLCPNALVVPVFVFEPNPPKLAGLEPNKGFVLVPVAPVPAPNSPVPGAVCCWVLCWFEGAPNALVDPNKFVVAG